MATYSSTNGIKLISTGDEAGTWGTSSNVNWQITDVAANGFISIVLSTTTYTLPVDAQPSAAQNGHYKAIKFTGTPGGTCTVTLEQNDRARMYMLVNSTNQTIIVTQGSGANVTISAGDSAIVIANGTGSGANVELFTPNGAPLATIVVTVADPSNVGNRFYIDGSLQQTLEILPSVTYRFDLSDSSNSGHPLRFSATSDGTHASPAGSEYTTGVVTSGTPGEAGSYIQITLEQDAPQTLYYYCAVHPVMGGKVEGRVTPLATVVVTVADPSNIGNRFYIDGALQQIVEISPSITYRFDQSNSSNSGHPIRFSTTSDGTHASPAGVEYTTGVVTSGTPGVAGAYTQITLPQDAPQILYYYCAVHPVMGGKVVGRDAPLSTVAVTVADPSSGNRYYIDGSLQQTVEIAPSITYRFDQSDASNSGHPFRFSTTPDGTHATPAGVEYTTGVVTIGTPGVAGAYTQITLEQDAPQILYYYCAVHTVMGGKVVGRLGSYELYAENPLSATTSSATGDNAVAVGSAAVADAEQGVAIGADSAASGLKSIALGVFAKADSSFSTALGYYSRARRTGQKAYASGSFANQGDAQRGTYVLRCITTDLETATVLTTDEGVASAINQIVVEPGAAMMFKCLLVGRQDSAGSDSFAFEYTGVVRNDSGTVTVTSTLGFSNASSAVPTVTLAADNTLKALKIEVTGEGSSNIRWVATVDTSEVSWS